ncbi:hypothetical protein LXM25_05745 [Dyadobacter sp. LJ53]|uniref:hypothetical protein n=1 Tax=Dyadobacter chenwenxiniae TaxID=2906456 RepID=UPI001F426EE2|nr:hypothetical protein [Dyadobacter chenwenxiniae]MCF0049546.1 hypothetical protein [Dyadobacter chenwenxiniae]
MNILPNNLNEAIANVILATNTDEVRQTSFLFSDYGHLLTAGHTFENSNYKIGDKCRIVFSRTDELGNDIGDSFEASIEEYQFLPSRGIDYAVLRISDLAFYKQKRKKLKIRKYESIKNPSREFNAAGYSHDFHLASLYLWTGKILQPVKHNDAPWWMQLNMTNKKNLRGASGSPIIVNDYVVAIQGNQDKDLRTQACLIDAIPSGIVKKELKDGMEKFYFSKTIFKNNNLRILQPKDKTNPFKAIDTRYLLFLYNTGAIEQVKLYSSTAYTKPLENLADDLLRKIKNIKNSRKINITRLQSTQLDYVSLSDTVRVFAEVDGYPGISENLRIIIDLGSGLADTAGADWIRHRIENISHNVLIRTQITSAASVNILSDENHNLIFEINNNSEEYIAKVIHNIIVDTLLDICYFYSVDGLTSTFTKQLDKQSFSKRKVQYAIDNNLSIYSSRIDNEIDYLSFAYACRRDANGQLNIQQYLSTWNDFLGGRDGIFSALDEILTPLDDESIIRRLLSVPKLSGQLSINELKNKLSKLKAVKPNELFMFALLDGHPKKFEEAALETIFSSRRAKAFEFLPISQLPVLAKYSHLVKLFFFVKTQS